MSANFIILYASTIFIASIIPGPSMLLALTHGMQYGAKRSVASAMGNLSVTILQALVSIAGLGTILIASETAFQLLKFAGALYMVYIGISILRAPAGSFFTPSEQKKTSAAPLRKMFMQAAFVTAGNPKAIVFFTAVFPQFIDPQMGFIEQSSMLISIGAFIAFICFMIYAMGGQKIVSWFSNASIGKYISRVIGTSFIGAGIGLALSD